MLPNVRLRPMAAGAILTNRGRSAAWRTRTNMDRFRQHLRNHLQFLARSAAAYDAGHIDEAIRLATSIRVICHQTSRSTSLLVHLEADQTPLLSTCRDVRALAGSRGARIESFNGMAMFGTGGYRAKLGEGSFHELLPAGSWWSHIVYVVDSVTWLSRRDIVLNVADKDGGAHVDARLTPEYEALIRPGSLGVVVSVSQWEATEWPISDGHLLALRQMAHELLNSEALVALAA